MKAVAWVGAVILLAGLVVLAVAGISGATAVLVTAVALTAMIALGSAMGGRHTPDIEPAATGAQPGRGSGDGPDSAGGHESGAVPETGVGDTEALDPAGDGADGADGGTMTR